MWRTLFIAALTLSVRAEDWPRFLGPSGNGISRETGLVDDFPKDGLPINWSIPVGAGYSAPSIASGKLVVFHRVKDEETVEALNLADGKTLWKISYPFI